MPIMTGLTEGALIIASALVCGLVLEIFRQPAILGYILAGVLLGPSVLAFVEDQTVIRVFADFGILMVLFLVGMELDISRCRDTLPVSLATMMLQVVMGLSVSWGIAWVFGWELPFTLLMGFLIALSSTAVAVKVLENVEEFHTESGRLAVGVLIAQDLAIVPMMLILRHVNSGINWCVLGGKLLLAIGILSLFILFLGRHQKVHLWGATFFVRNEDLTPLAGLGLCFFFATFAAFLDLSAAYGAFLAGLILGNSHERDKLMESMHPIYSILLMFFFLSIGLLMDLSFILTHWKIIVPLLLLITLVKTIFNISILHFLKRPWNQAFLVGIVLAQLGEFSFLLVAIGREEGFLSIYQNQLLMTLTVLSLSLSSLWFFMAQRLHDHLDTQHTSLLQVLRRLYIAYISGKKVQKKQFKWLRVRSRMTPPESHHSKDQPAEEHQGYLLEQDNTSKPDETHIDPDDRT